MKRLILVLLPILFLTSCQNVQYHHKQQQQLEELEAQLMNGSLTQSSTFPFQFDLTLSKDDNDIQYQLTFQDFETAMYDVKIVVKALDEDSDIVSFGFDENQTVNIIPFQENEKKGYYGSISLKGRISDVSGRLGVIFQWQAVSSVTSYQRYIEINCADYSVSE